MTTTEDRDAWVDNGDGTATNGNITRGPAVRPIQLPVVADNVSVVARVPGDPLVIIWYDCGDVWRINISSDCIAISCSGYPSDEKVDKVCDQLLGDDHVLPVCVSLRQDIYLDDFS